MAPTPSASAYKTPLRGFPSRQARNKSVAWASLPEELSMNCIYCGGRTEVTNSRRQKRNNQVWRRRQCLKCKTVVTTQETIDYSSALWVGPENAPKPFLED